MIRGVGIDIADSRDISRCLDTESLGESFIRRTFTQAEQAAAPSGDRQRREYFSARFAAKEAVFKAVAHLTAEKAFDLRIVETLHHEDGSPYINITPDLQSILDAAGVATLHISISTEGDYAAAFVVAEGLA